MNSASALRIRLGYYVISTGGAKAHGDLRLPSLAANFSLLHRTCDRNHRARNHCARNYWTYPCCVVATQRVCTMGQASSMPAPYTATNQTTPAWTQGGRQELMRIAATVAEYTPEMLALACQSVGDVEVSLEVHPLVYLPPINAIACRRCRHTLPASRRGLARHLRAHDPAAISLSGPESRVQAAQLSAIVQRCGGLTLEAAAAIPNGRYYFPSLHLYTDSLTCVQRGCGWVYAGVDDLFKVGKRHMNSVHGVKLSPTSSHEPHFVRGLPTQRIERLESGREVRYFLTAVPASIVSVEDNDV